MNLRDAQDLLCLIERFVNGGERVKSVAAEIESLVVECFQDETWFDETSEALALFVPGGTAPYVGESSLARRLSLVACELSSFLNEHGMLGGG